MSDISLKKTNKRFDFEMSRAPSATRVVAYLPSLKTILQRLRATSATPSSLNPTLFTSSPPRTRARTGEGQDHTQTVATHSQQTVTGSYQHQQQQQAVVTTSYAGLTSSPVSSLTAQLSLHPAFPLPGAVSIAGLTKTILPHNDSADSASFTQTEEDCSSVISWIRNKPQGTVEFVAQEVPEFLAADFLLLFPGVSVEKEELSVITLSQRTSNDMTSWSMEVEEEREQLLEHFIDSAKEICSRLNGAGYWADFIDPSSGRAYFSAYSSVTLFETDDRYRYLGFEIMDLGCCKCIRHRVWGAFTFVGAIFTSAPINSPAVKAIMEL